MLCYCFVTNNLRVWVNFMTWHYLVTEDNERKQLTWLWHRLCLRFFWRRRLFSTSGFFLLNFVWCILVYLSWCGRSSTHSYPAISHQTTYVVHRVQTFFVTQFLGKLKQHDAMNVSNSFNEWCNDVSPTDKIICKTSQTKTFWVTLYLCFCRLL